MADQPSNWNALQGYAAPATPATSVAPAVEPTVTEIVGAQPASEVPTVPDSQELIDESFYQQAQQDIADEREFGNRPIAAGLAGAARSGTFGLSDVAATETGLVSPNTLQKLQEQNKTADLVGNVTGLVGSTIASGGTGLAAKTVGAAGKALNVAGRAAESLAVKAAGTGLKGTIAGLAARGAAEGALVGVGDAISDAALSDKPLSAEAILADAGHSALMGAGFGAAIGTGQVTGKLLSKGVKKGVEAVKPFTSQFISPLTDQTQAVAGQVASRARQSTMLRNLGKDADSLADYVSTNLDEGGVFGNVQSRASNNKKVMNVVGEEIGGHIDILDAQLAANGTGIQRANVFDGLLNYIDDAKAKLINAGEGINKAQLKKLKIYEGDLRKFKAQETPFSFKQLNDFRKRIGDDLELRGTEKNTAAAKAASSMYGPIREVMDELALVVNPEVGRRLAEANKKLFIAKTIDNFLQAHAKSAPNILNTSTLGYVTHVARESVRNVTVKYDLANKVLNYAKRIDDGIADSLQNAGRTRTKVDVPALRTLLTTELATSNAQKPKNKQEAFANISSNLAELQNPETLVDVLATKTARVSNADPAVGQQLQQKLATNIAFLQSKLPKSSVRSGVFQRPYVPSSMELAKFERYLQVIEQPESVLGEIKRGTLTREHVEALQVAYPELYKRIQFAVMDKIATNELQLPYAKKIQLGILLGVPADSSLQSENLLQLQQSIAAEFEQPQPRPAGIDRLDIAGRTGTGVENIEAKK